MAQWGCIAPPYKLGLRVLLGQFNHMETNQEVTYTEESSVKTEKITKAVRTIQADTGKNKIQPKT